MKKNDWILIISVLLYSILFYQQSAGINFLLFNVALIAFLVIRDQSVLKSKTWMSVALGALLSSFMIFKYGSALAIWANLISLFILSAISFDARTSFFTSVLVSTCSVGSSIAFMFIDWFNRKSVSVEGVYKRPFYVKFFLILLPFLVGLLFFFFYQTSNPLFKEFTKNINLDFISFAWIAFTLGGLLLLYGFFYNQKLKSIMDMDANAPADLTESMIVKDSFWNSLMRIDNEFLSGMILFAMLNFLLLIVNVLDFNYLWMDGTLPKGMSHKQFVHNGIGVLITSIVIAIFIILFYFRGGINFYEKNKWIKWMAYLWIFQNLFMLFSTGYRNNLYIDESGLSYKKIGVYVYLLLTFIGLLTTLIKVYKIKTNWYLFKINGVFYYTILVISTIPNWDVLITDFNIKKHTEGKKDLEKYLLLDLSYKNLPQLMSLPDSIKNKEDYKARDYYNFLRDSNYENFRSDLDRKYYDFIYDYNRMEWQSKCLEKDRTYADLIEVSKHIDSFGLANFRNPISLKDLSLLINLKSLDLTANTVSNLSDLKQFQELEQLNWSSYPYKSVNTLPVLPKLKLLNLSDHHLTQIVKIGEFVNLEELDISGYNAAIKSIAPIFKLRKLKKLTVQNISYQQVELLKKYLPNTELIVK